MRFEKGFSGRFGLWLFPCSLLLVGLVLSLASRLPGDAASAVVKGSGVLPCRALSFLHVPLLWPSLLRMGRRFSSKSARAATRSAVGSWSGRICKTWPNSATWPG